MNIFKTFAFRFSQAILNLGVALLRFPEPKKVDNLDAVALYLKEQGKNNPLIVCGKTIGSSPILQHLLAALNKQDVAYAIFSSARPDPDFACIEEGKKHYLDANCDCLISIGGGSSIDCAKAMQAIIASPKPLSYFRGALKVKGKVPLHIAIPTTAGTGSEGTVAAVITDEEHDDKFAIASPSLVPSLAALCPHLLLNSPKKLIASCGMDAYTHALESYLNHSGTKKSNAYALKAMSLIEENLRKFYDDPLDEASAAKMLEASYIAGVSFSTGYVGYVHALAHALGGRFHLGHGYCNAILLPYVLSAYGRKIRKKIGIIQEHLGINEDYIEHLRKLNAYLGLPSSFQIDYSDEDIEFLSAHAEKEGNPLYPVPKLLTKEELALILKEALR